MLTNDFPCSTAKYDTHMNVQASYFMSGLYWKVIGHFQEIRMDKRETNLVSKNKHAGKLLSLCSILKETHKLQFRNKLCSFENYSDLVFAREIHSRDSQPLQPISLYIYFRRLIDHLGKQIARRHCVALGLPTFQIKRQGFVIFIHYLRRHHASACQQHTFVHSFLIVQ